MRVAQIHLLVVEGSLIERAGWSDPSLHYVEEVLVDSLHAGVFAGTGMMLQALLGVDA